MTGHTGTASKSGLISMTCKYDSHDRGQPSLSEFLKLVQAYHVDSEIEAAPGGITVLAPTNEAVDAVTSAQARELRTSGAYEYTLRYHVLEGYLSYAELLSLGDGGRAITTAAGPTLVAFAQDGNVLVQSGNLTVNVTTPDVAANGRLSVQGIDKVLIPPTIPANSAKVPAAASSPSSILAPTGLPAPIASPTTPASIAPTGSATGSSGGSDAGSPTPPPPPPLPAASAKGSAHVAAFESCISAMTFLLAAALCLR